MRPTTKNLMTEPGARMFHTQRFGGIVLSPTRGLRTKDGMELPMDPEELTRLGCDVDPTLRMHLVKAKVQADITRNYEAAQAAYKQQVAEMEQKAREEARRREQELLQQAAQEEYARRMQSGEQVSPYRIYNEYGTAYTPPAPPSPQPVGGGASLPPLPFS